MFICVKQYSPEIKDKLHRAVEDQLKKEGLSFLTENILKCLDELLKNALKANYKYCLIRENIEDNLRKKGYSWDIVGERKQYNAYAEQYGNIPEVSFILKRALSQEAKLIQFRSKARKENRRLTTLELQLLSSARELVKVKKLVQKFGAKIHIRIDVFKGSLEVEVINDAPILEKDLKRIYEKRLQFNKLADAGNEVLFFTEYLDDSEAGAGLGYATIDATLRAMSIRPLEALTIITVSNTTISISADLKTIQKSFGDKNRSGIIHTDGLAVS